MNLSKTKVYVLIFIIVSILIIGFLYTLNYPAKLMLGEKVFDVDVASNAYTLARGYSGQESIGSNEGMLFVFDKLDRHGIWMKDMLFSIDIIWMDENFVINHIEENVGPETYPMVFYPDELAMYVLEIRAGEVGRLGVKIGDKVNLLDKEKI